MEAREFYKKRLHEDGTLSVIELMEEYAKHVIEINFCNGSPIDFDSLTVEQLKQQNDSVNLCVDWANT